MPKISVNLVTFNAEKYLDACLESVRCQNFRDFQILIIDNGSKDKTREKIGEWEKIFGKEGIEFKAIYNEENLGFAEGHNIGFKKVQSLKFKVQSDDKRFSHTQLGEKNCDQSMVASQSSARDCGGGETHLLSPSREGELTNSVQYVCCLNQDIILHPDYFEKIIAFMDDYPECGAASGKLMRILKDELFFEILKTHPLSPSREGELPDGILLIDYERLAKECKIIDSVGLRMFKSGRAVEIGQGEEDKGQYDEIKEVFGISGTVPVYRVEALEDVKLESPTTFPPADGPSSGRRRTTHPLPLSRGEKIYEYFDKDFGNYKEDVDLAYRLRWRGWKSFTVPGAIAYHKRGARQLKNKLGDFTAAFNRKNKSKYLNYCSQRNQIWMLVKNLEKLNFATLWYEMKKFGYEMIFEWSTFKAWFGIWKKLGAMREKRRWIMENRKVSNEEMDKWIG